MVLRHGAPFHEIDVERRYPFKGTSPPKTRLTAFKSAIVNLHGRERSEERDDRFSLSLARIKEERDKIVACELELEILEQKKELLLDRLRKNNNGGWRNATGTPTAASFGVS